MQKPIPNGVIGILFLIAAELMFFSGLISAFIVNKAGMTWPPVGQPRLPVEVTAISTFVLLASGYALFAAIKKYRNHLVTGSVTRIFISILLGGIFLFIQGAEWVKLIGFGLTATSSIYGAFFYLIIGAHGLHVFAGLMLLVYMAVVIRKPFRMAGTESAMEKVFACSLFWYFVVGIWPVLYVTVYLL